MCLLWRGEDGVSRDDKVTSRKGVVMFSRSEERAVEAPHQNWWNRSLVCFWVTPRSCVYICTIYYNIDEWANYCFADEITRIIMYVCGRDICCMPTRCTHTRSKLTIRTFAYVNAISADSVSALYSYRAR